MDEAKTTGQRARLVAPIPSVCQQANTEANANPALAHTTVSPQGNALRVMGQTHVDPNATADHAPEELGRGNQGTSLASSQLNAPKQRPYAERRPTQVGIHHVSLWSVNSIMNVNNTVISVVSDAKIPTVKPNNTSQPVPASTPVPTARPAKRPTPR